VADAVVEAARDVAMTRVRRSKKVLVVVVVAIALLTFAGQRAWSWQSQISDQGQRDAAISAASAEVARLISVSATDSDAAIAELLAGATASFREDLQKQATQLQQALVANKVDADGTTVSAGIGRFVDDQATVFVAATGTVSNAGATAPQNRDYRVKVEMQKVGDRWLVAGLEFVA